MTPSYASLRDVTVSATSDQDFIAEFGAPDVNSSLWRAADGPTREAAIAELAKVLANELNLVLVMEV